MKSLIVLLTTIFLLLSACTAPAASPEAIEATDEPQVTDGESESEVPGPIDVTAAAGEPGDDRNGGELVIALYAEPSTIDPHRTATVDAIMPIMQACESLVLMDGDGSYVPHLASDWEVSEDGLQYTFYLREGVNFHDGTPFNAEAVKYNFDRIVDPDTQSQQSINWLATYTSTDVADELTAVVNLEEPYAPFLEGVSSGWLCMVSPTAASEWGPEEFQDHFVGTGPFIFREWRRQDSIRLERNPDYWGGSEFFEHTGPAYLDSILFNFITEGSVRAGALGTGELHVATDIPAIEVAALEENPSTTVISEPPPGTPVLLLFNMNKAPTDDLNVRQALNYAIDPTAFSNVLYQGVHDPAYGPLTPSSPCYWEGVEQMYAFDPTRAETLLEEAGWVVGDDGIRTRDGERLVLDFPSNGGFPRFADVGPILQAQLADVGIELNFEPLAAPAWLEAGRTGDLHIGITQWPNRDSGLNLRIVFFSENATSFAWNWHDNAELDAMIEEGMVTVDNAARCQIYEEVQRVVMEDAMTRPLHQWNRVWAVRNNVQGFKLDESFPAVFWAYDIYLEDVN